MLVERTDWSYDLDKCLIEWELIQSRLGDVLWSDADKYRNQTSLQRSKECVNNPYLDGVGPIIKTDNVTLDFSILNEGYENTTFADVIRDTGGVRSRIMILEQGTAYSVHYDKTPRYHMALITNPNAYFIFPTLNEIIHIPSDGFVYEVDTTIPHSFVNCGEERTHLVISKGV